MVDQFINLLKQYANISEADKQIIADAMQQKHFKEGDFLFKEGKICNELFFVINGVLRISGINELGNEITYFFIGENHLCTIMMSFINRVPSGESLIAACNTNVLSITYSQLQQLYIQLPYLQNIIQQIQQNAFMQKIALRNLFLNHEDATNRYKLFIDKMPTIAARVSLSSIASYLGITPQSLSRIRRSLK